MSYFGFTPGFSDKILDDYIAGRDLSLSIPGTSAIDAEHFAVQMVGYAVLMTVPVEEIGELEGEGGVRDDLVSLMIAERLIEHARKHPQLREALLERVERIHLRVAESPVATMAIWYPDLYSDLAWSLCRRGEHERALDMARRAVAHTLTLSQGENLLQYLKDLARHTFIARPDDGAHLWVRLIEHDPTHVWTYVQLGFLGADVGLPDLAQRARRRGLQVIQGRHDEMSRSVRKQLEREVREEIEASPVAISEHALAELHRALEGVSAPSVESDEALALELVPSLASVPVKRRPTAADIPPRQEVLGALGDASSPRRSAAEVSLDLLHRRPPPRALAAVRTGPKVGRNDPCPCGSGRKWKKCCGALAGA